MTYPSIVTIRNLKQTSDFINDGQLIVNSTSIVDIDDYNCNASGTDSIIVNFYNDGIKKLKVYNVKHTGTLSGSLIKVSGLTPESIIELVNCSSNCNLVSFDDEVENVTLNISNCTGFVEESINKTWTVNNNKESL